MGILKHFARAVKRTVRQREFWFTVAVYPFFAACYTYVKGSRWLKDVVGKTGVWYFACSFMVFSYAVLAVACEIIEKKLKHKVQGDKLKIKQRQAGR